MRQENLLQTICPLMSGMATAGLAMTFSPAPALAQAQSAAGGGDDPQAAARDATMLKPVPVTAEESRNTNEASTGAPSRMLGNVKETPQIIQVIPKELIEEQRATSLEQILKNVPGITLSTGEGRGGLNGDMFRMRGLSSAGDVYVDGLKDFGAYKRDSFNTESVEVIKGPSGEAFGVGNVGGLINQTSKKAHLGETSIDLDQSIGSASTYRTTVDGNVKLNDTSAIRINGMFQEGNTPGRDNAADDRRGLALDFGTGLGTDTEWHLGYSYLHRSSKPDYGIPMAQGADNIYRPLDQYGVPGFSSSTSYIRSTDRDLSNTHILSSLFTKRLGNGITISNDTRLSFYDRDFSSTNPAAVSYANLQRLLAGQTVALSYGAGGGMTYRQHGWGVQNVTSAKGDFDIGGLRNQLLVGLDLNYQRDNRTQGTWTGRTSNQTVVNPSYAVSGASVAYGSASNEASSSDVGLFMSDRLWLTKEFSLLGGLRWDSFSSDYSGVGFYDVGGGSATSQKVSPSISGIWEPAKNVMLYAAASRTYKPIGSDIALSPGTLDSQVAMGSVLNHPERSDRVEVGTKLDLLDERLGVTGAVFQIDKSHSYTVDPATGEISSGFSESGEGYRIRGFEVGLTGKITSAWTASVAYSYLDGKVSESDTASSIGHAAPGAPHNNFTAWTSYAVLQSLLPLPGRLTVGGGLQYASEYWADSANTALIPETFSMDAMVAYKWGRYRVSLNLYNLTDHRNYSSAFSSSRVVPASGRAATLNLGVTF